MPRDPYPYPLDDDTPADTRPRRPVTYKTNHWSMIAPLAIVGGLAVMGVIVVVLAALLIRAQTLTVTVIVDSDAQQTQTRVETVGDLLAQLGIVVTDYDTISPTQDTRLTEGMVIRIDKARSVMLAVDGETRVFWTPLTNPADILASAGLVAGERDRVLVDGTETTPEDLAAWPVPATRIALRHALPVHVIDGDERLSVYTTSGTVGQALFELGVTLYLADTVSPDVNTPVTANMEVSIYRSRPVSIIADGKTVQTRSQGSTVADALADAGVALVGMDYTLPGEDAPLQPGMHIRVIRVREESVIEETTLPFETLYQEDAGMELDQRAVIQTGQEGRQQTRVRVRYENGIETSRTPEETTIIQEARNHIIGYGTKIVLRTVDTPEGAREYWRVLHMYATSYHPAALGGDNITATGRILTTGIVGINPRIIPYGTQVFVSGYGIGVAADTGGPRRIPLWIDLGYSDEEYKAWSRYVDVYLLTPVPDQIDYFLP
jgi:resuscitation-promoting factor RpfB